MKMKKIISIVAFAGITILFSVFMPHSFLFAFDKTITIPAETPEGVAVNLKKGSYIAEFAGGAVALFYPISPNYRWLIAVAVGSDVEGGQDEPNIGMLYFEPDPPVYSQFEAEQKARNAVQENVQGTYLEFILAEDTPVRFWVTDFDYTDNSGIIKLQIRSIQ